MGNASADSQSDCPHGKSLLFRCYRSMHLILITVCVLFGTVCRNGNEESLCKQKR